MRVTGFGRWAAGAAVALLIGFSTRAGPGHDERRRRPRTSSPVPVSSALYRTTVPAAPTVAILGITPQLDLPVKIGEKVHLMVAISNPTAAPISHLRAAGPPR